MVARLGQRVQGHAEFGQRRGHDDDPLRPETGDVYVHAHAAMMQGAGAPDPAPHTPERLPAPPACAERGPGGAPVSGREGAAGAK
ncbi:hypothetical protein SHKM778_05030 [Streptomyces sp. KM77-8]|uniref:Uncharacterized protein n=1 Tax=Streptomyces haneummycinicus TaxID=3074435 RepID=A0AAT9H9M5_9ACTN